MPFRLGHQAPQAAWAIRALDRLRELDLLPGNPPSPITVPLTGEGQQLIESFARAMQYCPQGAGPFLRSALGKARGQALRLALVLELLWWSGRDGASPPPTRITPRAVTAAAGLIGDYFLPMAELVYGDRAATQRERDAAELARWILKTGAAEVHIRHLQRHVRLPGFRNAAQMRAAAEMLVASGWLLPPARSTRFGPRQRISYPVSPRLWSPKVKNDPDLTVLSCCSLMSGGTNGSHSVQCVSALGSSGVGITTG